MHILKLPGNPHRNLRQLPWHRHRMVQVRTRIMNQQHHARQLSIALVRFCAGGDQRWSSLPRHFHWQIHPTGV